MIYNTLQSTKHRMLRNRLVSQVDMVFQNKNIHPFWNGRPLIDLFWGRNPRLLGQFHQHLMWFSDTIDLRRLQDCKFFGFLWENGPDIEIDIMDAN